MAESIDTATWLFMVDDVGTVRGMCRQPSMAAVESKQSGVALESKQSMANLFSSAAMHAFRFSFTFRCSLDHGASLMAERLSPVSFDPLKSFAIGHSAI